MTTTAEIAARFNVDAAALDSLIADAVELVCSGVALEDAFLQAAANRENFCAMMLSDMYNCEGERTRAIVEQMGTITYDRIRKVPS